MKFKLFFYSIFIFISINSYDLLSSIINIPKNNKSYITKNKIPAVGTLEIAFSPRGGAESLIIRVINSAKKEIKILAYSFTSPSIVSALLNAKKRGVSISIVADYKGNISKNTKRKKQSALSALSLSGCDVRVISAFRIHHDKVLIIDKKTVELGSFNYSVAAEKYNSENVLVNWDNPELAKIYLLHFKNNYDKSLPFKRRY